MQSAKIKLDEYCQLYVVVNTLLLAFKVYPVVSCVHFAVIPMMY